MVCVVGMHGERREQKGNLRGMYAQIPERGQSKT